jgi:pilus assembly protein CpaF
LNDDLFELVLDHPELADLDPAARRLALRSLVADALETSDVSVHATRLADLIDGFGSLTAVMSDEDVTDVLVNGPEEVWVERAGSLQRADVSLGRDELDALLHRLMDDAGARLDLSHPIASARLANGARIHAVLPPVAPAGPLVSIRRFPARPLGIADLTRAGFMTEEQRARLVEVVHARHSIAIGGATGTGKTTLLNALLMCIPGHERIVTIEEVAELHVAGRHVASLVGREPNIEGRGGIDLVTLVRAALRMRPDRIVVGEVRGAEAVAALAALSTGHEGSMVTVHARSTAGALSRIVDLGLQASSGASERALERQVRRAFDVVVHLERGEGGRRRVASVDDVG